MFSLGRAIAILGSTAFGLITLGLCMLCQLKPGHSFTEDLHIIVGFYLFCEIFTCCMFVTEASNYYQVTIFRNFRNLMVISISQSYLLY